MPRAHGGLQFGIQDAVQDEVNKRMSILRDTSIASHEAPRPRSDPFRGLSTAARPSLFPAFVTNPPAPPVPQHFPVIRLRRI